MSDPQPESIMCVPTAWKPVAGLPSIRTQCTRCLQDVWLSWTMAPMAQGHGGTMTVVCMACTEGEDMTNAGLHPRQIPELRRQGVMDQALDFVAELKKGAKPWERH